MTDLRTLILEAIDRLQVGVHLVDADDIAKRVGKVKPVVSSELRAMSKAGIVVYDRKAAGWRRA